MARQKKGASAPEVRDRVGELIRVPAGDLAGAPWNWRRHPKRQEAAVVASLEELGIYAPLLGRRLADGTVELIDGHLRRAIFQRLDPATLVPVVLCDLDEVEAKKANLLHDPLAGLAETDAEQLDGLLREVQTANPELAGLMDEMAKDAGLEWTGGSGGGENANDAGEEQLPPSQYLVQVECESEEHQAEVLARLAEMGLACKALLF